MELAFMSLRLSNFKNIVSYEGLGEHCWSNSIPVMVILAESNLAMRDVSCGCAPKKFEGI